MKDDAVLTTAQTDVGYAAGGTGSVIQSGGSFNTTNYLVGNAAGSTGSVVQTGGTVTASSWYSIGEYGRAPTSSRVV